ncbi:unnamed protein product [Eruca vesicaria subsp. sativa]|uniref:Uncharacterized protein n=1 Tax=Eruca vesicaria subsp. sativa TaxID=29727 RepID=A0ABC8J0B0_ERUVS|nr:unnamed protein product [Eruca vesicaria subsp. sativa]
MSFQGNLSEDLHPASAGSSEPLMRLTAENEGNPNMLDELNYEPDIPTPNWTPNCLSTVPYQHVPLSSSSGMYGEQPLVPSSLVGQQEEPLASRYNIRSHFLEYIRRKTRNLQLFILFLNLSGSYRTCSQQRLPYMHPSSSTNPQYNISPVSRPQLSSSSSRYRYMLYDYICTKNIYKCKLQRRCQRQCNQHPLERGESSSVSRRQLQPSLLGTEGNLNNHCISTQSRHAIQQQHGNNFHVQPNNQGLYNQRMMDSAPRQSETLTGVSQQPNARITALQEPNNPTMQQHQQQFRRLYDPTSTFGAPGCLSSATYQDVPFASSSGMHSQQPLAPSSLVGGQNKSSASMMLNASTREDIDQKVTNLSLKNHHLLLNERSPYGPYDERYDAGGQYLDPHMRKFEKCLRKGK